MRRTDLALIVLALTVPFLVDAVWILAYNNATIGRIVEEMTSRHPAAWLVLVTIEYLTCTLAGFAFLARVKGWGQTEFRIAYFPAMLALLLVFRLFAGQLFFGRGAI